MEIAPQNHMSLQGISVVLAQEQPFCPGQLRAKLMVSKALKPMQTAVVLCLAVALMTAWRGDASGSSAEALGLTNGAFRMQLNDLPQPAMPLAIEASSNLVNWVGIYTNFLPEASQEFVDLRATNYAHRFYRGRQMSPLFVFAMATKGRVDLNGDNFVTDSFDSLTTNNVQGRFDPSVALHHGDIGAYGGITNWSNAWINGSVATGPNVTVSDLGTITGSITHDMTDDFPEIASPFSVGWAAPEVTNNTIIDGVTYRAIFKGGTGNNYDISPLSQYSLSFMKVRIEGIVSILFRSGFKVSGNGAFVLAPGAKLTIYTGGDTDISGNGFNNSGDPTQLSIYGLSTCLNMSVQGNGDFCGLIYAPYANLGIGGGGSAHYGFTGATVSKTSTMNGNVEFYYDERVRRAGPMR